MLGCSIASGLAYSPHVFFFLPSPSCAPHTAPDLGGYVLSNIFCGGSGNHQRHSLRGDQVGRGPIGSSPLIITYGRCQLHEPRPPRGLWGIQKPFRTGGSVRTRGAMLELCRGVASREACKTSTQPTGRDGGGARVRIPRAKDYRLHETLLGPGGGCRRSSREGRREGGDA